MSEKKDRLIAVLTETVELQNEVIEQMEKQFELTNMVGEFTVDIAEMLNDRIMYYENETVLQFIKRKFARVKTDKI